jgi:uncharacterized protein
MTDPLIIDDHSSSPARRPGVGWTELSVAAVAYLALQIALGVALFAATGGVLPGPVPLLGVTALGTFGAVAIALLPRVRSVAPLRLRNPGVRWWWLGLAAGVGVFLVNRLVVILWVLLTGDTSNPQAVLADGALAGGWSLAATIALGGLIIPLAEEMLFRGIGFTALRRYGLLTGVLGSALIFALAHGFSVVLVAAFVIGVVNALMMERSGSLWPGVVAHATNNTVLFVIVAVS